MTSSSPSLAASAKRLHSSAELSLDGSVDSLEKCNNGVEILPLPSSTTTTTVSALDRLKQIDDDDDKTDFQRMKDHSANSMLSPDVIRGNWGRSKMDVLKDAALSSKTVYSYCFVHSTHTSNATYGSNNNINSSALIGFGLVLICLVVQIVIPLSIIILMQPVQGIENVETKVCPRRSNGLTKFLAFVLSAYFIILTLGLCTNKLRGLNYLRNFVDLGSTRKLCIEIGIMAQLVGIFVASAAEYLLFIGNGNKYVALLLQSLAMQFCLVVDQNIVSHQVGAWTANRLEVITENQFLALDTGGIGEPDKPMPTGTLAKVTYMVESEKKVLVVFVIIGLFFSTTLAICM